MENQKLNPFPLRVATVVKEAVKFPFNQTYVFWVWVATLCFLSLVISHAEKFFVIPIMRDFSLPPKSMIGVKTMVGGLGQAWVFTLLAIPCHRMILLEEKYDRWGDFYEWSQRETWYLVWAFLLFNVAFLIFIFIPVLTKLLLQSEFFGILTYLKPEWPISIIFISTIYIIGIPLALFFFLLYGLSRVILVLPATAIDKHPTLSWAWNHSWRNGRSFTLINIIPIIFVSYLAGSSEAIMEVFPWAPFWVPEVLGNVMFVFWGILEVVLLSEGYKVLRSNQEAFL